MATLSRANEPNSHATLIILRKLKKSRTPTDTHHQDERELNFCLFGFGVEFPCYIVGVDEREMDKSKKDRVL